MNLIDYIYDDDFSLRVKEEYKIHKNLEVFDYMHGRCHLFALIASEILKAPLQAYVAPHAEFSFCLSHVFCRINKNTIFDATGVWNLYSMRDKFEEPGMYLHSDGFRLKQELLEMMEKKELPSFQKEETANIIKYLENMKKVGCMQIIVKENEPMVNIEDLINPDIKNYKMKKIKG